MIDEHVFLVQFDKDMCASVVMLVENAKENQMLKGKSTSGNGKLTYLHPHLAHLHPCCFATRVGQPARIPQGAAPSPETAEGRLREALKYQI